MVLIFVIFICVLQVLIYRLLDKYGRSKFKLLVNVLLAICHIVVFPLLFTLQEPEGPKCGMGNLVIMLVFWVFGFGGMIAVFLVYEYGNKLVNWLQNIKL